MSDLEDAIGNVVFNGEAQQVSLADIAGVDMAGIEEVRFELTPPGKFIWNIKNAEIALIEDLEDKNNPGEKRNAPIIRFELEAENCLALVDDEKDPAQFIGQKHQQTFWINDVVKDLGKAKAFLVDIGLEGTGAMKDLLDASVGMTFVSDIVHNKNKDNPDRPYVNMRNIQSLDEYNQEQQGSTDSEQAETPSKPTLAIGGLGK